MFMWYVSIGGPGFVAELRREMCPFICSFLCKKGKEKGMK